MEDKVFRNSHPPSRSYQQPFTHQGALVGTKAEGKPKPASALPVPAHHSTRNPLLLRAQRHRARRVEILGHKECGMMQMDCRREEM